MGITDNKKEGDRKTPSGIYGFDIAFGLAENPGTNIIYKQIKMIIGLMIQIQNITING